jgi:hypothetical protein
VDITIIRNRCKKGVKVEQILIGSERVGRVQGGHHNNPLTTVTDYCDVHLVLDQYVQNQSVFSLLLLLSDYGYGLL